MFHNIRIKYTESDGKVPRFRKIFLDDKEIVGVTAADLRWRPDEIPTLKMEIIAENVEIDDYFVVEAKQKEQENQGGTK